MADYGADPGGFKWLAEQKDHASEREAALKRRVTELEAEVKRLRGINKYVVKVTFEAEYEVEAKSAGDARKWYDKHGTRVVPTKQGIAKVVVYDEQGNTLSD